MKINELNQKQNFEPKVKLQEIYIQFEKLLVELRKRDLPDGLVLSINNDIEEINATFSSDSELKKTIKKRQRRILKLLEKDYKLVPKNYYRNLWLGLGMSAFGIPIGVAIGTSTGNMAFLGIGLPIGLAIGISVGSGMDKKAFDENRQLDVDLKF